MRHLGHGMYQERLGLAAMNTTGPNDARCVVWALGMSFFFCNRDLLILTYLFTLFRLYLPYNSMGKGGFNLVEQCKLVLSSYHSK